MKKILLIITLFCFAFGANAQSVPMVFQDWTSTTGSQSFFYKNVVKTDASGNVYIAGATINQDGNYDILVAKYNASGATTWIRQYDGTGNANDAAGGLYIDGSGNVYVTGFTTTSTDVDMVTIKYNSSGTQQWLTTYNGTGSLYDAGADLVVDGSGNVYVTGSSFNSTPNTDIVTLKYNSSGTQQWVTRYNHTANLNDAGVKITFKSSTVYVSGVVQCGATSYTYAAFKYNASSGAQLASSIGNPVTTAIDQVNDMVEDASGNVYIAGSAPVTGQGYDYDIIKLNTNLVFQWEVTYNGANSLDDFAKGIRVDATNGYVYVTGTSKTTAQEKNMVTMQLANSNGHQNWAVTYNDSLNGNDEANAMDIDNSGNIYVTGYATTATDNKDYFTIKYDENGDEIWHINTDGNAHLDDKATNIAVTNTGDVVVVGTSETAPGTYECLTVKYVQHDVITPTDFNGEQPQNSFAYYANKGQLINTSDSLIPDVKYYVQNSNPAYFVKDTSFSFVFARIDGDTATTDTLHRIDVNFDKASTSAHTYAMEEKKDYLNYFLGHCPDGITEVRGNNRLITPNLFSNIDLMYSSNQDGLKYYFIVKPGGNPADIKFIFDGASSFNLDSTSNALTINSSIGSLTFERPTMYQLETNNTVDTITGWTPAWQTNGASNKYKFYVGSYTTTKPLIIQIDGGHSAFSPNANGNLEWSTYYGSNSLDVGYSIINDANGNIFVGGYTYSTNFPTTPGAYQDSLVSGDMVNGVLMKFNNLRQIQWATYIGGSDADEIRSLSFFNNSLYATGYTFSGNFPAITQGGAYNDLSQNGNADAFFTSINPTNGFPTWSTFFGGSGDDRGYSLSSNNSYIYLTGYCYNNFPAQTLSGAFSQPSYGGGLSDGYIAKFNTQNQLLWCTFYGGNNVDCPHSCKVDNSDNLYVWGSTNSTNLSLLDAGGTSYFQDTIKGDYDCFILKFDNNGARQWATLFGGNQFDTGAESDGIAVTSNGVFFIGSTQSTNLPTQSFGINSYYQPTFGGGGMDAFIVGFDQGQNLIWNTYIGDTDVDVGEAITSDLTGNLFISGTSISPNFPLVNLTNAYYQTYGGSHNLQLGDVFLSAFNANSLALVWSTFIGGDGIYNNTGGDVGYSISTYQNSKLYITGGSNSTNPKYYLSDPGNGAYFQPTLVNEWFPDIIISEFNLSTILLSINDVSLNNSSILVYPNPSDGIANIVLPQNISDKAIIQITNILGQKIFEYTHKNEKVIKIDLTDFSSGLYLLNITIGNKYYSQKIIKE